MNRFNAYIDESGDNGFTWYDDGTGSTRWFVLGAVVVRETNDRELSFVIDKIKERLNIPCEKPLHWVDRKHKQRKYITELISNKEFTFITVGMDKFEINPESKLREYPALYLYAARFLMERVSWFVDSHDGVVNCIFEHRENLSYDELRSYIRSQIVDKDSQIRPEVISGIQAKEGWQFKNLQVADACTGTVFNALETNKFGHVEPTYFLNLRKKLYRRNEKTLQYGLKLFPHEYQALRSMEGLTWIEEIAK